VMTMAKTKKKAKARKARSGISAARLAEMLEEATVDAYDESEQVTGWFTMLENYLDLPFDTDVLGVRVVVERIDLREENRIVAVCKRGKERLAIDIMELPVPRPRPPGSEWIEAFRQWRGGQ
jgi:hypothetical protein